MKKAISWIVSILLIITGMAMSVEHIVTGLLFIISGLLFMPPFIKMLASKKQFMFLAKNAWLSTAIASVFCLISFTSMFVSIMDSADKQAIASYNADPTKALSEAKQALEQKDFVMAKIRAERYLKLLPNNPELKSFIAQIDSEKAEAEKQAELNRQAELSKQQANVDTATGYSANAGGKPLLYCVMVAGQDMGCFSSNAKCAGVSASYKGSSCKAIPCGENGTICPR
jgi:hypothetical protein